MKKDNLSEKFINNILESVAEYYRKNDEVRIEITEEMIQGEAEQEIERPLNREELEGVEQELDETIWMTIRDAIREAVSYNELLSTGKDAEKSFPHYQVYWRNKDMFKNNFEPVMVFRTKEKAVEYTKRCKFGNSENEWQIVEINSAEELSTKKSQLTEGIPPVPQQGKSKTTTCRLCFPQNQDNKDGATPLD